MNNFQRALLDCVGVLVDSEGIANKVFVKALNEECGFSLDMIITLSGAERMQSHDL